MFYHIGTRSFLQQNSKPFDVIECRFDCVSIPLSHLRLKAYAHISSSQRRRVSALSRFKCRTGTWAQQFIRVGVGEIWMIRMSVRMSPRAPAREQNTCAYRPCSAYVGGLFSPEKKVTSVACTCVSSSEFGDRGELLLVCFFCKRRWWHLKVRSEVSCSQGFRDKWKTLAVGALSLFKCWVIGNVSFPGFALKCEDYFDVELVLPSFRAGNVRTTKHVQLAKVEQVKLQRLFFCVCSSLSRIFWKNDIIRNLWNFHLTQFYNFHRVTIIIATCWFTLKTKHAAIKVVLSVPFRI